MLLPQTFCGGNMREGHLSIIKWKCTTVVWNAQSSFHSSVSLLVSADCSKQWFVKWMIVYNLKGSQTIQSHVSTWKCLLLTAGHSNVAGGPSVLCKISFGNLTWECCQICRLLYVSQVLLDFTQSSPRAWATEQEPCKKASKPMVLPFFPSLEPRT